MAPTKEPEPVVTPPYVPRERGTFVVKAEAFVLSHPEGVRTRDVATGIGQDVSSVDGTLRSCCAEG